MAAVPTTGKLKKDVSALQLFTLGFGSIVGVGWILLVGVWLEEAGSAGSMLAFFLGGLGMILVGLCYCAAARRFPAGGGEITYFHEFFGIGPAFAAGWIVALLFIVGSAFEAIAVGWLATIIAPAMAGPVLYELMGAEVRAGQLLVGLIMMVMVMLVNLRGVRTVAWFQDLITYGLIAISGVCFVIALVWGELSNLAPLFIADRDGSALPGIAAVLTMIPVFYLGFNVIAHALGEKSDTVTSGQVSKAIVSSIFGAIVFYVAIIFMTSAAAPRATLLDHEMPAYVAFSELLGSTQAGKIVLVAGLLGLISSWNAIFFAAARVILSLARLGTIPERFAFVHPRYGTPVPAILLVAAIGSVGALLGIAGLVPIVNALGSGMTLVFAGIAWGILRTSKQNTPGRPAGRAGERAVAALALIFSLAVFVIGMNHAYRAGNGGVPLEWWILAIWLTLGAALWIGAGGRHRTLSATAQRAIVDGESPMEGIAPVEGQPSRRACNRKSDLENFRI